MNRFGWSNAIGLGAAGVLLITLAGSRALGREEAALSASVPGEPAAVHKAVGIAAPNALFSGLIETPVAQGSTPLENPTAQLPFYRYDPPPPMLPPPPHIQPPPP